MKQRKRNMEGTVVTQFGVPSPHSFWRSIQKKGETLRQIAGFGFDIERRHRPGYDAWCLSIRWWCSP